MSQIYVPDKIYLVCTDGMKTQQIKVTSQYTIKIAGGRLGATIDDRTGGNFICAKMIVAAAIAGAILAAIVVLTAPVSIGIGVAMAAGAAAGAVTGGLASMIPCTCALLTMPKKWAPVHPVVMFENKKALIEKSILPCILGGNVLIQYSEEAAQAAVDLNRKKTAFSVGFIIGAAYLAGPAVEGLFSSASSAIGIFKGFGVVAGFNYLGGLGVGFATNYAIDYGKDQVKGQVYKQLGVNQYVEGYDTNLQKIQEQQDPEETEPSELYDNSKRSGESAEAGQKNTGNRVGDYETVDYQSKTVLNDGSGGMEEYQSDQTSTATPGAIAGKQKTVNTVTSNDLYSDQSGSYMNEETYTQTTGKEYKPLNLQDNKKVSYGAGSGWLEDYKSKPQFSQKGVKGGGWATDLMMDAYKGITNYLLKGDIEKYIESLHKAEKEAKSGVTVIENQV